MSTKLPEPLPYEYVDELIDSEIEFEQFLHTTPEKDELIVFTATYRDRHRYRGNFSRDLISLIEVNYDFVEEDEEGFCDLPHASGMKWRAQELTEEEIERILDDMET